MIAQRIVDGLYRIPVKTVNAFYLDLPEGGILIDTGFPDRGETILAALREIGRQPTDVRHILLTHAHPDHIGNAAVLKARTGANVQIHALDAQIARNGGGFRPVYPAPGLINRFMKAFVLGRIRQVDPVPVDHELTDGEVLTEAGNLRVIHVPGHCLGQVAFLWPQHGGILFAADACMNLNRLVWTFVYEDFDEGNRSLLTLSELNFQIACFGHGRVLAHDAGTRFREWVNKNVMVKSR